MSQQTQNELVGRRFLGLIVVAGLVFSALSGLILSDGFGIIQSNESVTSQNLCENGFCKINSQDSTPITFVQQGEDTSPSSMTVSSNEIFTDLKLEKTVMPTREYEHFGNKSTLFAEKDSFIREGLKDTNEGSNKILRVMGSGPTNNRSLVTFSQDDIEAVLDGKNLESATIKLFVVSNDGNWNSGQYVNLHKMTADWNEGKGSNAPINNVGQLEMGASWSCSTDVENCSDWNGGHFVQTPTDSVFISNHVREGYWIKFDVTEDVRGFLSGSPNYGWIIMKSDEDSSGRINFASRESNSNIPEMVMVLSK